MMGSFFNGLNGLIMYGMSGNNSCCRKK